MATRKRRLMFVLGTRPEAIKLAPLIKECQRQNEAFDVTVCVTGQHRELLDSVLAFFEIRPDYDLAVMRRNQTLGSATSLVLSELTAVLDTVAPDEVIVQGDTTTAFVGALAGYYKKVRISHVEAGLRSRMKYAPFPEEAYRTLISHLADSHFAPTAQSAKCLAEEGIHKNVWVVGNTVIDSLFLTLDYIKRRGETRYREHFDYLDFSKRIILVTAHRRENFGEPLQQIFHALRRICRSFDDVQVIYPVHLNPNIVGPARDVLGNVPNLFLVDAVDYPHLVWLMNRSHLVLTDSGGIQEEAPSLGKPVLVMRDVTERTEGIEAGTARLVGTCARSIVDETSALLTDRRRYRKMATATNPYGDGRSCKRIVKVLKRRAA